MDPSIAALGAGALVLVALLAWSIARVSRQAAELHGREMGLLDHLRELRYRALASLAALGAAATVLFSFGYRWFVVAERLVPVPWPTVEESFASRGLNLLLDHALPGFVQVFAMTPTEAIMALLKTSMIGAIVLAAPVVAYQVAAFVAPALRPGERRIVAQLALPALVLYLLGVAFALLLMVPVTLRLLYAYAEPIGAQAIAQPGDVLTFVLFSTLVFGVAFQTPLVMGGLSRGGLVSPAAMGRHWRGIVVGVLVAGAVLTDPNPITQLLVGGPLILLYAIGLLVAKLAWRGDRADTASFE